MRLRDPDELRTPTGVDADPGTPLGPTAPRDTPHPDDETSTRAPNDETTSRAPDDETTSRAPDNVTTSRAPDDETTSRAPDNETTGELDRVRSAPSADLSPPRGGPALRPCPNCGGPNSPRRELCGRCGADLDTGTVLPRLDGQEYDDPDRQGPGRARRSLVAPLLAALAVVALVVAGLAVAGLLPPGGDEPSLPGAQFDPDTYGGELERLTISEIATLTTLPDAGGESYAPSQMVDDDPTTAWNSDGRAADTEDGVGERIELVLDRPAWVTRVVIRNGDHRDADTYAANARIRRAQMTLDGGVVLLVNLLDEGLAAQAVEFPEPVLTTGVSIEVLDTFPGDTHPDLAVSDLELQGWSAQGRDVEVADERAAARPATSSGS